jgi:hypothetical protein
MLTLLRLPVNRSRRPRMVYAAAAPVHTLFLLAGAPVPTMFCECQVSAAASGASADVLDERSFSKPRPRVVGKAGKDRYRQSAHPITYRPTARA